MRPQGLITVAQALVVEGIIEALNQFQTNDTIVCHTILGDGFATDVRGEGIEAIDAGWVKDFVYTAAVKTLVWLSECDCHVRRRAHNGLSSLGLNAEPLIINFVFELGYRE